MRAIAIWVAPTCLISVCLKAEGHRIHGGPDHHRWPGECLITGAVVRAGSGDRDPGVRQGGWPDRLSYDSTERLSSETSLRGREVMRVVWHRVAS
jgi:hypothetical protein